MRVRYADLVTFDLRYYYQLHLL